MESFFGNKSVDFPICQTFPFGDHALTFRTIRMSDINIYAGHAEVFAKTNTDVDSEFEESIDEVKRSSDEGSAFRYVERDDTGVTDAARHQKHSDADQDFRIAVESQHSQKKTSRLCNKFRCTSDVSSTEVLTLRRRMEQLSPLDTTRKRSYDVQDSNTDDSGAGNYVGRLKKARGVGMATFCKAFPFHFVFNREMKLLQVGMAFFRAIDTWKANQIFFGRRSSKENAVFFEHFRITSPGSLADDANVTFERILRRVNETFSIQVINGRGKCGEISSTKSRRGTAMEVNTEFSKSLNVDEILGLPV